METLCFLIGLCMGMGIMALILMPKREAPKPPEPAEKPPLPEMYTDRAGCTYDPVTRRIVRK